jgi:hypothetical protein
VHSHIVEGARLQIQSEEISFQSVKRQYHNSLRQHLLLRHNEFRDEFDLESTDFVLITGTGTTTGNWETDAISLSRMGAAVGGGANVRTVIIRNPGFNTGPMHPHPPEPMTPGETPASTETAATPLPQISLTIPTSSSVSEAEPGTQSPGVSTTVAFADLINLFPRRDPYLRFCYQRLECPERKKQYVFVDTMRFRSPALLVPERFTIEGSAGLKYLVRAQVPRLEHPTTLTRTQSSGADSSQQAAVLQGETLLVDCMEGFASISDFVCL